MEFAWITSRFLNSTYKKVVEKYAILQSFSAD